MKKVTYKHPINDTTDYLVPLKSEYPHLKSIETRVIRSSSPPSGLFSSIYFPISLVIYIPIVILQLIIGLIYVNKCPVQYLIEIWMIISGIFGLLLIAVGIFIHVKLRQQSSSSSSSILRKLIPCFILLFLFVVVWFFAGQVFVFEVKTYVEFFDPTLPEYCHGTLYRSAYVLIFIDYLILLLGIILNILTCIVPPN